MFNVTEESDFIITLEKRAIARTLLKLPTDDSTSTTSTISLITPGRFKRAFQQSNDESEVEPPIIKETTLRNSVDIGNLNTPAAQEAIRQYMLMEEAKLTKSTSPLTAASSTEPNSDATEKIQEAQPISTNGEEDKEAAASEDVNEEVTEVLPTETPTVEEQPIPVTPAKSAEMIAFEALEDYSDNGETIVFRYRTPKGKFDSITDLCTILNNRIKTRLRDLEWAKKVNPKNFLKQPPVTFEYDLLEKRVKFVSFYPGTTIDYKSSAYLPFALGFVPSKTGDITKVNNHAIAAEEASLTHTYPAMFIYTNMIEYQLVGDTYAPLLRTVSMRTSANEEVISELFTRPFYHELNRNYIKSIEIRICNDAGEDIIFQKGKTVLVLHFRTRALI